MVVIGSGAVLLWWAIVIAALMITVVVNKCQEGDLSLEHK